jgi:hypothetical protein
MVVWMCTTLPGQCATFPDSLHFQRSQKAHIPACMLDCMCNTLEACTQVLIRPDEDPRGPETPGPTTVKLGPARATSRRPPRPATAAAAAPGGSAGASSLGRMPPQQRHHQQQPERATRSGTPQAATPPPPARGQRSASPDFSSAIKGRRSR